MINRNSNVPLYVQLSDELRKQIFEKKIKVGEKLMSESQLMEKYNVARLTVREALGILVNEGLIEKYHGKGTFCKTNSIKKYKVDVLLSLSDVYFIPYYMRSICAELDENNINVVLADTKNDEQTILNHLERILSEGSNGIIFQPVNTNNFASKELIEILDTLQKSSIPYVMIDTFYKNLPPSYVVMNDEQAGKISAEYFTQMGHQNLLGIIKNKRVDSVMRINGFCSALSNPPHILEYDDNFEKNLIDVLKKNKDITGIFCYHDGIAKSCYEILNKNKIKIPEDISIISVDDTIISQILFPPLTSVIHPKEYLGKAAAKAICDIIFKKSLWPYKKVYEPTLAIRKSVREL